MGVGSPRPRSPTVLPPSSLTHPVSHPSPLTPCSSPPVQVRAEVSPTTPLLHLYSENLISSLHKCNLTMARVCTFLGVEPLANNCVARDSGGRGPKGGHGTSAVRGTLWDGRPEGGRQGDDG
jgi:hypothetical protein